MARILIADDFHPSLTGLLEEADLDFVYLPELKREGILKHLQQGTEVLVMRSKTRADRELLATGPALKLVARGGAGMDNIDETAATDLGILCVNAGEANSDSVGEHTLGMLLSLLHNLARADREVRQGLWQREANRGVELKGKTVGIIGYGNTGSAVANKLAGFETQVLAYDKYKKGFGKAGIEEVSLQVIQNEADIITFHVPLTRHTKHMVNSDFIQGCVRNIWLLNLSRGEIVDTRAVISALESGKIRGFAADVLEHEDPRSMGDADREWFDKLTASHRVVLSPHIGGWTAESYQRISMVLAAKIIQYFHK
ncbi:MAG: phosphoglycerate dehydrogenase [Bacteroidetes bacterium]|nr:phosphoglycerate dehydrogenase [Bacteroidota bacterium]